MLSTSPRLAKLDCPELALQHSVIRAKAYGALSVRGHLLRFTRKCGHRRILKVLTAKVSQSSGFVLPWACRLCVERQHTADRGNGSECANHLPEPTSCGSSSRIRMKANNLALSLKDLSYLSGSSSISAYLRHFVYGVEAAVWSKLGRPRP